MSAPDAGRKPHYAAFDLFRVLALGLIGWYHLWQQSWVSAGPLDTAVRTGGLWVFCLILLSAFCLFLPYAEEMAAGRTPADCRPLEFYRRRAVRILPSYYAALAAALAVTLVQNGWTQGLTTDLLSHLVLMNQYFYWGDRGTRLMGVAWTLTVLTVLYLLFPLLQRAVCRRPLPVLAGMCALEGLDTVILLKIQDRIDLGRAHNWFSAYWGVVAVGFAGALVFARLRRCAWAQRLPEKITFSAAGWFFLWLAFRLLRGSLAAENLSVWRLLHRMPLSLCVCASMICLALGLPLPGRRTLAFLSGISYNFYLWHQNLALWMKYYWHIPAWTGETPPNQLGDTAWMHRYNLQSWGMALAAAILFTYAVEKPAARWLARLHDKRRAKAAPAP